MSEPDRSRRPTFGRWLALAVIVLPFLLGLVMPDETDRDTEQFETSVAVGHETRDLPVTGIVAFGILLIIATGLVFVLITALQILYVGGPRAASFPPTDLANAPIPVLPPQPRPEAVPGEQLQQLLAEEDRILKSYGWVDQKSGLVHIPIERAMDILVQRGLPVRPEARDKFKDDGRQSPSYPSSGRVMEEYP